MKEQLPRNLDGEPQRAGYDMAFRLGSAALDLTSLQLMEGRGFAGYGPGAPWPPKPRPTPTPRPQTYIVP